MGSAFPGRGFVGVFDSGVGGVSVLAQLHAQLPAEDFLFYGDSLNAPYGEKPREWVLERSREITNRLIEDGAKAIVIACNTATSAAAACLRDEFAHVPIIGVEPALKPATLAPGVSRILVMATPITLRLDKYQQLAQRWGTGHEVIDAPCPGLADCIEGGDIDSPRLHELLQRLVGCYAGQVDAVVLGCTHYAFAAEAIRTVIGEVPFFDGAAGTARHLKARLAERGDLAQGSAPGRIEFQTSDPTGAALGVYERFLELGMRSTTTLPEGASRTSTAPRAASTRL